MGKSQAHRRRGGCHEGEPGKSSRSEWYHLLYFHCIKVLVMCSGGLRLLHPLFLEQAGYWDGNAHF